MDNILRGPTMTNVNPTWWHQVQAVEPLHAVRVVASCLEAGTPVPGPEGKLVAKALRKYLEGKKDITSNLGLRPRAGGRYEDPLVQDRRRERDIRIKAAYEAYPGRNASVKAAGVARLLQAPNEPSQITEAHVFAYILELRKNFEGELPTSARQVQRIAQGGTLTGRRKGM